MRVAVCDDDKVYCVEAAKKLAALADRQDVGLRISLFDTIDALLSSEELSSIGLVFMDIEFDGKPAGIEAAKRINQAAPNCRVVYLTDYIQYSVDVYQTDHVWFVVKSQFKRRLPEIFEKLERIEEAKRSQLVVTLKDGSVLNLPSKDSLVLERRKRITFITTTAATYETPEKLADICKKLPEAPFAYSHNSYVVNMVHILTLI